jgi:MFS family permease
MWTMLLWGFSTNLPMAITARALEGLGNGNVGILRTTVAELCPWKELQPRAFSVMPLVYTIGAIIGPVLGGALSNPLRIDPRKPRGDAFLERYPYCLPNIVAAVFFSIGIVVGFLFLHETLESKRDHQDLGLRTGARLTAFVRKLLGIGKKGDPLEPEHEPLLGRRKVVDNSASAVDTVATKPKSEKPKIRDVLTYQTTLNLVVYTILALYSVTYDQVSRHSRSACIVLTSCSWFRSFSTILHKHWMIPKSASPSSSLEALVSTRDELAPCLRSLRYLQPCSSSSYFHDLRETSAY